MDTKQCSMCKEIKSRSDFSVRKDRSSGLQSRCRSCANKHRRFVYRTNDREKEIQRSKDRKQMIRKWLNEYKSSLSCVKCGENHPATIVFHHHNDDKEFSIAAARGRGMSIERIKKEIAKCIVLCANCHCKEHWNGK